jgi:hypothetical protein
MFQTTANNHGLEQISISGVMFYHKPMKLTNAMKLAHRLLKSASPIIGTLIDTDLNNVAKGDISGDKIVDGVRTVLNEFTEDDLEKTMKDILKFSSVLSEDYKALNIDNMDASDAMVVFELIYKLCEVNLRPFLEGFLEKMPANSQDSQEQELAQSDSQS